MAVNVIDILAVHGDAWRTCSCAGGVVADDATLASSGCVRIVAHAISTGSLPDIPPCDLALVVGDVCPD